MEEIKNDNKVQISAEDLNGLKIREDVLINKKIEINLFQNERDSYWISLVKKYNLDEKKIYVVDKDGFLTEKQDNKENK